MYCHYKFVHVLCVFKFSHTKLLSVIIKTERESSTCFLLNSFTTISISGTTGSGKTTFVSKLIQNMAEIFASVTPRRVLNCYGVYQNEFQVTESRFPFVTFQKGLPSDSDIEELSGDHNLIVIDDLMNE